MSLTINMDKEISLGFKYGLAKGNTKSYQKEDHQDTLAPGQYPRLLSLSYSGRVCAGVQYDLLELTEQTDLLPV